MLELSDIKKTYRMGEHEVGALKGVSFTIEDGDFVAIMGPSGSGKSTLMHILGLLDVPTDGSYKIDGREVSKLSEDELAVLRREAIGFIFQQFNLLTRMSAAENVSLPLLYSQNHLDIPLAQELLGKVGLGQRAFHRPNELSGGQQQRVAIARSLINKPLMILADEPTGNLDSQSEKEIMAILKDLNAQGITVVVVTHEEEIGTQAKRLIRMRDGVVQSDERLDVLRKTDASQAGAAAKASKSGNEALEYIRQGFKTLLGNKVRTALSMLGILIGVAAVVAMLAIGRGAQKDIEERLTSLGSNLLVLRPGAARKAGVASEGASNRITLDDVEELAKNPSVKKVAATVNSRGQVVYLNKNWNTSFIGASPAGETIRDLTPTVGRFFTEDENKRRARVAVISPTVAREIFGEANPIGEMIKLNRVNFQVIGVLPAKSANNFYDDCVIVPLLTAMYRLMGKVFVDSVDIEINNPDQMETAEEEILEQINARHRIGISQQQGAFEIRNMADIKEAMTESSKTMSTLLACIAAISLLVGGIGIMNIMLVSVTERTKEIGLRKAIGARRRDILAQFLAEAVVVSTIGGLFGILLGWAITQAVAVFAGWSTSISLASIALAFTFSASIGIVFGIYPARKAASLHPIEALRYE